MWKRGHQWDSANRSGKKVSQIRVVAVDKGRKQLLDIPGRWYGQDLLMKQKGKDGEELRGKEAISR